MMFRFIPIVLLLAISSLEAKEPVMLLKGKLLAEETFESADLSGGWEATGDVMVADGQLQWASEKGGKKASLNSIFQKTKGVTFGDHILEYTVRYHRELYRNQIVYNDKHGHAIIIQLSPELHHVRKWPDQDALHRFEEFPDASGSSLRPGELYTVMVEMRGSELLVHINDENFLFGENYRAGRAKHRLVVSFEGGRGTLDSVRLWEGTPSPDWGKDREAWVSKRQERPPWDPEARKDFDFQLRVAELRRKLRENNDPDYAAIVNDTAAFLKDVRSLYPFYRAKPTRKNLAAQKDARRNDEKFQSMLKELARLEKRELAYFQRLDPA
ncbi:MAG: hypothetical protein ACKVHE_27620, partial [Planctomycetales bacterium]